MDVALVMVLNVFSCLKKMETNKHAKVQMIRTILSDISRAKYGHYRRFCKLKRINTIIKTVVHGLNTTSVCSLVLSFTPVSPVCTIIALSATTGSAITSAVSSAWELEHKIHSHQTSYLQYVDIYRDVSARLFRNGLTSTDLDTMLSELNARLGLIEDNSLPFQQSHANHTPESVMRQIQPLLEQTSNGHNNHTVNNMRSPRTSTHTTNDLKSTRTLTHLPPVDVYSSPSSTVTSSWEISDSDAPWSGIPPKFVLDRETNCTIHAFTVLYV